MLKVHAIIPSRGDVDLSRICSHLRQYPEIALISIEVGDTPFNRYLAAWRSRFDLVYTQDDDCITDIQPLLDAWPGFAEDSRARGEITPKGFVNAMTVEHFSNYPGAETLIGFGALFHCQLVQPLMKWTRDALFLRESDRVFGTIAPHLTLFPKIDICDWSSAPNRYWMQRDHLAMRDEIRRRIEEETGIHHGGR